MRKRKAFTKALYGHAVRQRNLAGFTLTELPVVRKRAFTLIELLTVIFIMIILASLSILMVSNLQKKARDGQRFSDMNTMIAALKNYKLEHGSYPGLDYSFPRDWVKLDHTALTAALKPYQSPLPSDPKKDSSYFYTYHFYFSGCGVGSFAVLAIKKVEVSSNKYKEKAACDGGVLNWDDYDYSYLLN